MTRIGSLCTGYGGLDMAVEAVFGGTLAWVSDIDKGANTLLAHRYPDVPNLGDLKVVDWSTVEPVDILTAGYPCQPFSQAGQRKGVDDPRHIFPNIADAIGVLRPGIIVLENVFGHLSKGGLEVVGTLATLGYDCRWTVVRASDIGACHQRKRLFIVARDQRDAATNTVLDGYGDSGASRRTEAPLEPATPDSDNEGPQGAQSAGRQDVSAGRNLPTPRTSDGNGTGAHGDGGLDLRTAVQTLADTDVGGRRSLVVDVHAGQPDVDWGVYAEAIARHEHSFGQPAPRPVTDAGRLSPQFVEWMMMLPEGHVTDVPGLSRTAQPKLLGNGVVPPQAEYAIRQLLAVPAVAA